MKVIISSKLFLIPFEYTNKKAPCCLQLWPLFEAISNWQNWTIKCIYSHMESFSPCTYAVKLYELRWYLVEYENCIAAKYPTFPWRI